MNTNSINRTPLLGAAALGVGCWAGRVRFAAKTVKLNGEMVGNILLAGYCCGECDPDEVPGGALVGRP